MKRKDGKKRNHPGNAKNLKPWRKGQSGNPAGRRTAGANVTEEMNSLSARRVTPAQLRKIVDDPKTDYNRYLAALRMLRSIENPNMARYEAYLEGKDSLEDLEGKGIDTTLVKKAKITVVESESSTTTRREIELHDRSLAEAEFVCDRTEGRPKQALEVSSDGNLELRTADDESAAAAAILDRCRQLMSKPG